VISPKGGDRDSHETKEKSLPETKLTYENLDVYKCSIQFLAVCTTIVEKLPKGNSTLLDQLKRASLSIILNIAEACGKTSAKDNSRFFSIARGSAMECGAVLDACRVLKLSDEKTLDEGKILIVRIVSMLSKMCR
jgi:four helix bundle protein